MRLYRPMILCFVLFSSRGCIYHYVSPNFRLDEALNNTLPNCQDNHHKIEKEKLAGKIAGNLAARAAVSLITDDPLAPSVAGSMFGEQMGSLAEAEAAVNAHVNYHPRKNATSRLTIILSSFTGPNFYVENAEFPPISVFVLTQDDTIVFREKFVKGDNVEMSVALPPGSHILILSEYFSFLDESPFYETRYGWGAGGKLILWIVTEHRKATIIHGEYNTGTFIRGDYEERRWFLE